jgi:hypothetical protein
MENKGPLIFISQTSFYDSKQIKESIPEKFSSSHQFYTTKPSVEDVKKFTELSACLKLDVSQKAFDDYFVKLLSDDNNIQIILNTLWVIGFNPELLFMTSYTEGKLVNLKATATEDINRLMFFFNSIIKAIKERYKLKINFKIKGALYTTDVKGVVSIAINSVFKETIGINSPFNDMTYSLQKHRELVLLHCFFVNPTFLYTIYYVVASGYRSDFSVYGKKKENKIKEQTVNKELSEQKDIIQSKPVKGADLTSVIYRIVLNNSKYVLSLNYKGLSEKGKDNLSYYVSDENFQKSIKVLLQNNQANMARIIYAKALKSDEDFINGPFKSFMKKSSNIAREIQTKKKLKQEKDLEKSKNISKSLKNDKKVKKTKAKKQNNDAIKDKRSNFTGGEKSSLYERSNMSFFE